MTLKNGGRAEKFEEERRFISKVLVIGCPELQELPFWYLEKFFGTYTVLESNGGIFDPADSKELEAKLFENPGIEHIVLCPHNVCDLLAESVGRFLKISRKPEPRLFVLNSLMLIERTLAFSMAELGLFLEKSGRKEIEVHGWFYEPEIDWISAFETETGHLVPLNSYTRLYRACNFDSKV